MALRPPSNEPIANAATGMVSVAWVAYLQDLADALAKLEARLKAANVP